MPKTLCKLKQEARAKKQVDVDDPDATHVCRKCQRAAKTKKRLCKPKKIKR